VYPLEHRAASLLLLLLPLVAAASSAGVVADLPHKLVKRLLDVNAALGRCLEEGTSKALGKILPLRHANLTLVLEIAFVACQYHWHLVFILYTKDLLAERRDFVKGGSRGDGINAKKSLACAHVLISHSAILLLARSIQDVEKAGLVIDGNLLTVRILDGRVVLVDEMVLDQLDREGGLPDTTASNYYKLVFSHVAVCGRK